MVNRIPPGADVIESNLSLALDYFCCWKLGCKLQQENQRTSPSRQGKRQEGWVPLPFLSLYSGPHWGGPLIAEPTSANASPHVKASSQTPRRDVQSGDPVTRKASTGPLQQSLKNSSFSEVVYETTPQRLWTRFWDTDSGAKEFRKGRSWFGLEKSGVTL